MSVIDGARIARDIQEETRVYLRACAVVPHVAFFCVGNDPVIAHYVSRKRAYAKRVGIECTEVVLSYDTTTEGLIASINEQTERVDGIVVQLPLPSHIDTDAVIAALPEEKDIDALIGVNSPFESPVAGAVREIIERYAILLDRRAVAVIGKGRLVGAPVAAYFRSTSASRVVVIDKSASRETFSKTLAQADIVVSGAGVPGLITPALLRDGVVVLDAGTSSSAGTVIGDVEPGCAEKASYIAQTPGGIGPITVAVLFQNAARAACQNL